MLLQSISSSGSNVSFRWDIELLGLKNGVNVTFITPEIFVQSGDEKIRVYYNGRRLFLADNYTVNESGGPGTGYDTVTLLTPKPPKFGARITADYTAI